MTLAICCSTRELEIELLSDMQNYNSQSYCEYALCQLPLSRSVIHGADRNTHRLALCLGFVHPK
jgi:hypothetical protein